MSSDSMSRPLVMLSALAALLSPAGVHAAEYLYNLPLGDCDMSTRSKCYVTAYYDLNKGSGTLKDWNCGTKTYSGHKGTDFGVNGTINVRPVLAAADGTVAYTNDGCYDQNYSTGSTCGGGYGNYVKISHADTGYSTYYAHMANGSITVKKGDKVKCGQLLGKAASSGNSTGPHLHFEVHYNSDSVRDDPYKGSCGGPLTYWKKQNGYKELPADDQCAPVEIDDAKFASETIPDDSEFTTGSTFTKTWTIKNTGNTTWIKGKGYKFVSIGGTQMSSVTSVDLGDSESIAPGATKTWSVPMTVPAAPGTYTHNWSMSHSGTNFGGAIFTRIKAVAPAESDGAKLVNENTPAGTQMQGGQSFTKTWTLQNTGNTTWTRAKGYRLVHTGGSLFSAVSPAELGESESIAPGGTKVWSMAMTAPESAQTHQGSWRMERSGAAFGDALSVSIEVTAPAPEPAPDPVPAPDAGPSPAEEDAALTPSGDAGTADWSGGNADAGSQGHQGPGWIGDVPEDGFVALESGCGAAPAGTGGGQALPSFGLLLARFVLRRPKRGA